MHADQAMGSLLGGVAQRIASDKAEGRAAVGRRLARRQARQTPKVATRTNPNRTVKKPGESVCIGGPMPPDPSGDRAACFWWITRALTASLGGSGQAPSG